jgi:hypothetical protein
MNNTEILNEISGTELGDEYLLVSGRIAYIHFDREKIRHNPSIKKAINRALSVSDIIFKIFFLLI